MASLSQPKVEVNVAEKKVYAFVPDKMNDELIQSFLAQYGKAVNSITPGEYHLEVDCTEMKVISPELVPSLEGTMGMYAKDGFNKVTFVVSGSPVFKMQMARIARSAGLDLEVVDAK